MNRRFSLPRASARWVLAVSLLAAALPYAVTHFPPASDLAQHVAQARLLGDVLAQRTALYEIHWLTPYSLAYLVFAPGALSWPLLGELAGRFGLCLLTLAWVAAAHALARRRGRSAAAAVLVSGLAFNLNLYWGFVPFYGGWPLFVLWLLALDAEDRVSTEPAPGGRSSHWFDGRLIALAAALYFCHALWFAAGAAWAVLSAWRGRVPARAWARRLTALAAPSIALVVWYPSLAARGFDSPSLWGSATERLQSALSFGLQGLRGPLEPLLLGVITLWVLAGWLSRDRSGGDPERRGDPPLLLAAALLFAFGLALPLKFQQVIYFADRWLPSALTLLVLGSPAPRLGERPRRVIAVVILALVGLSTAAVWLAVDAVEMAGFGASLDAVPEGARVLGLVYDDSSTLLQGLPFHNQIAWAQVEHGGVLSFSFAEFATALVTYRDPATVRWTPHLDWSAYAARPSDFPQFDVVLVQGSAADHAGVAALGNLEPLTPPARWRLYRPRTVPAG